MNNNITLITTAMVFYSFFVLPINSLAQAGQLDLGFGIGGKVTTSFGNLGDLANSVAIQSDGKIVVTGHSFLSGVNYAIALTRYNPNGSLDTTFDVDGKVTTSIGTLGQDLGLSTAIQSDGKILVGGSSRGAINNDDFALIRYNSNGSLDTSFDNDGKVTTSIGIYHEIGRSIAIQTDGKIIIAGESLNTTGYDFALVRYNTNGSLDTTFDTDGKVTTSFGNFHDNPSAITIQSDGKILVAGGSNNGNDFFAIARYNIDGSLDTTFDIDGKITTAIGLGNAYATSIAIQSNGKIVVAGSSHNSINYDFALVRYNIDGSLDTTFSNDGMVTTALGSSQDVISAVSIQPDGKIVAAGFSASSHYDFALARYNPNGSLDTTFDIDGKVKTDFGNKNDHGYSVALQNDGKIVLAGSSNDSSNQFVFALARYNNSITLSADEFNWQEPEIHIYPNPFSNATTFHLTNNLKHACLTVYNLFGKQVKQIKNLSGLKITLNRDNLTSGLYSTLLSQDNKIISRNMLVITD